MTPSHLLIVYTCVPPFLCLGADTRLALTVARNPLILQKLDSPTSHGPFTSERVL